jgi:hypothetical protein
MSQTILARVVSLYWTFVPGAHVITHATLETWEWKFCVQVAIAVEEQNAKTNAAIS